MKQLKDIITEKLRLDKNVKGQHYTCHPQNWYELRSIIEKRLKKDKDADLNDIDVSNINSLYEPSLDKGVFEGLDPHNIKIDKWDVSKVQYMDELFWKCVNFNSDLSCWDVSNVRSMNGIFYRCTSFNADLSKWDVSNVKYMVNMFDGCENFNADLSNWDVSKVETMKYMFDRCKSLKNKPTWYKDK